MRDLSVILFLLCLGMIIAGCLASAESLTDQGEDLYASGKYEEALVKFDEALKLNSTYIRALNGKGACFIETGDYQWAVACYDDALLIDPTSVYACDGKVCALCEWGKADTADEHYEEALVRYDEALALRPDRFEAIEGKYSIYIALGDASSGQEALGYYDEALALRPGRLDAIEGKCRTYIALGDASSGQEALGYYDEALALRPGRLDALIGKARILSSSSTYEAIQCYEKILTLSPDHKEARTELYALCDRMRPATSLLSSSGNRFFNSRVIESNQLEIDNSEGLRDVQAILIDSQYNTLGSHHKYVVYLRSGEKYTIYKIPGGTYNLFFSTGEHWNPNTQKFMESVRYRKFEEDLQFTSFSFRYSMISVTLYSVPGGTAAIVPVPENQFP